MPENDTELLIKKQYLNLLLETVTVFGIVLLTDTEVEIESRSQDVEITGYLKPFNFDKLLSRQEKLPTIFYFTFAVCRNNQIE